MKTILAMRETDMMNIPLDRRRLPQRRSTRVAALVALLALTGAAVYGAHAWTAHAATTDRFTIATVQRGDLEDTVASTGVLQPRDYVDVGTQVSGQLKNLHVEIGAAVKA